MTPQTIEILRAAALHGEPDRYLAATLSPVAARGDLLALAACAAEIRRIPDLVSEPMIGEIRLQWWRDAFGALMRGEITGNPIADTLGPALSSGRLDGAPLIALTEARAFDVYRDPMPDIAAFDGYLARTEGGLFQASVKLLGDATVAPVDPELCRSAGRAYGLARALFGLPQSLSRGRLVLPLDRLNRCGVTVEEMLAGNASAAVRDMIGTMCGEVRAALVLLAPPIAKLPPQQRRAFLPLCMVEPYLRLVESADRHVLRDRVDLAPLARSWRMMVARWRQII